MTENHERNIAISSLTFVMHRLYVIIHLFCNYYVVITYVNGIMISNYYVSIFKIINKPPVMLNPPQSKRNCCKYSLL